MAGFQAWIEFGGASKEQRASSLNSGMIGTGHARSKRLADFGRLPLCPTIPCTSYVRVSVFLVQCGILDH